MSIEDVDPSQIAIIGELNIVIALDIEEHWLVVVTRAGRVFETDSRGWGELFRERLSARMGVALDYCWRDCGGHLSRVIHPPELRDQPLYEFKNTSVPRKFLGIFDISDPPRIEWQLAPAIENYLEQAKGAGATSQLTVKPDKPAAKPENG